MFHVAVWLMVLVSLGGCATSTEIGLPSGEKGYALNCSGEALSWGACLQKAGETCGGRGYDILARINQPDK